MLRRPHIAMRRSTSVLTGLLMLSSCVTATAPPGKNQARLNSENEVCNRYAIHAPLGVMFDKAYASCMLHFGNTVQLADGTVLQPQAIAPPVPVSSQYHPQVAAATDRPIQPPDPEVATSRYQQTGAQSARLQSVSASDTAAPAERQANAEYASALDAILRKDAAGWSWYTYDAGSARNVQITERDGKAVEMRGDYSYNGGQTGWVRVDLSKQTPCLEYSDDKGACRPLGRSGSDSMGAVIGAAAALMALGILSQSGSNSSSGSYGSQTNTGYTPSPSPNNCGLHDWLGAPDALGGFGAGTYLGGGCH